MPIWYSLLRDLTPDDLLRGISMFCASHKEIYPNTNIVAYIREYALYDPEEVTPADAYEIAQKAWRRWSMYSPRRKFKNVLIEKTIETLGVRDILSSENPEILRAHFLKIYESYQKRDKIHKMIGYSKDISKELVEATNHNS